MPWSETNPMNERARFMVLHQEDLYSMSELCERFGIARRTGYKWVVRLDRAGRRALGAGGDKGPGMVGVSGSIPAGPPAGRELPPPGVTEREVRLLPMYPVGSVTDVPGKYTAGPSVAWSSSDV